MPQLLACSLKATNKVQSWEQKGSDLAQGADMKKLKSFFVSEDDEKRDKTRETVCYWDFNHSIFALLGNELTTVPIEETTRL